MFHISGTTYEEHTVCRVCEDIIFELSAGIDEEDLEQKIRKNIKHVLEEIIDSDVFDEDYD